MIINNNEYLLACLSDIEEQDLLDSLLPTDEVMQKTNNRGVLGSNNSLYDYFEGALDKHHGGKRYIWRGGVDIAMKKMKYKGYTGTISYCTENSIYYGKLVGIEDLVAYHSEEGVVELQNAFIDAVDDYIYLQNAFTDAIDDYIDLLECTY